ncbi:MAG: hypothetical protein A2521_14405 [Deltaproteobacteria bacterium RIFOXYD12_FULL_57_12]|nr:MAG: hypothetical protein A2521_14405 [Deltaproteobacteria bacterium RIFOXYD12_FULL_57_12]
MFRKKNLAILISTVVLLCWDEAPAAPGQTAPAVEAGQATTRTPADLRGQPVIAEPRDRDHSQENAQAPGETVTVVGVINNTYQLVTQNYEVFEIAETEAGNALIRLVNARVKVIGIVNEFEGQQLLLVLSFERITD